MSFFHTGMLFMLGLGLSAFADQYTAQVSGVWDCVNRDYSWSPQKASFQIDADTGFIRFVERGILGIETQGYATRHYQYRGEVKWVDFVLPEWREGERPLKVSAQVFVNIPDEPPSVQLILPSGRADLRYECKPRKAAPTPNHTGTGTGTTTPPTSSTGTPGANGTAGKASPSPAPAKKPAPAATKTNAPAAAPSGGKDPNAPGTPVTSVIKPVK